VDVFLVGEGFGAYDLRKACLERNARVLGCIDPGRSSTLHGKVPSIGLREAAGSSFDWIIIGNAHFAQCRQELVELGVPIVRILLFYEDVPGTLERLGPLRNLAFRRAGCIGKYEVHELGGKFTQDARTPVFGPSEAHLVDALGRMFQACRSGLKGENPLYQVGKSWENILEATRGNLYEAIDANDPRALHALLAHSFRNNLSWGLGGGEELFKGFCATPDEQVTAQVQSYLQVLHLSLGCDINLGSLGLPPAGNPFGLVLGGQALNANTIMNHYRSAHLSSLLMEIEAPVVAEIGGGVGYFARALLNRDPRVTYIDFDLPETLIVAAYNLATEFPDRRILFFDGSTQRLTAELLGSYDIVLMPTYMVSRLDDQTVDLFLNTISFGEMSVPIVNNYLKEMERTTRRFLYLENLSEICYELEAYDFENYAMDFFQIPESFKRIASSPDRWPGFATAARHTFTENLYLKRDKIR
jgi:hypothetical protein